MVKLRDKNAQRFLQNCFKTGPKAILRLLPATNQACLNQRVAGYKTFLQKGVIELLSTTCNSLICLRFIVEQTRKVALNSFAAILYKILRVFLIGFTTNSQVIKSFLKSIFELRVVSIKLSDNFDGNMRVCIS